MTSDATSGETPADPRSAAPQSFSERFRAYFERPIAQEAAQSLADGVRIEFRIQKAGGEADETFTFTRKGRRNLLLPEAVPNPELIFIVTPDAAEEVLADPAQDVPTIGINIAKLMLSPDANRRITAKVRIGMMGLFSQGYLGVIATGGVQFASFLASKGFEGLSAIKSTIQKMRE